MLDAVTYLAGLADDPMRPPIIDLHELRGYPSRCAGAGRALIVWHSDSRSSLTTSRPQVVSARFTQQAASTLLVTGLQGATRTLPIPRTQTTVAILVNRKSARNLTGLVEDSQAPPGIPAPAGR